MIVQCPSCEARYRIGTENVPQQGGKISCPSCSQSFIVYPEVVENDDDATRAGAVPFILQDVMGGGEPEIEDGTVEIQNPMRVWLESQKKMVSEPDDDATSVISPAEINFDNFSNDEDDLEDKTEMINLGDFLDLDHNSEVEYDATEVFSLDANNAQTVNSPSLPNLVGGLMANVQPATTPKSTLMMHAQNPPGLPPLNAPAGLPPLNAPSALPPLNAPSALPPIGAPSALPPIGAPSALPPIGAPSALPPIGAPSALPPIGAPSALPPIGAPSALAPIGAPPMNAHAPIGGHVAIVDPEPTQRSMDFQGPWKLRTNFGLTYEFPDTMSLNNWMASRDDVSGYTLAGKGEFYPLSNFPQIQVRHAGTSGSFHMQQPGDLPVADFLNAPAIPASAQIPMLQQAPTDYKAFAKSDTNVPAKKDILPILAWLFCGFSGLIMILSALYAFGIIGPSVPGIILVHFF